MNSAEPQKQSTVSSKRWTTPQILVLVLVPLLTPFLIFALFAMALGAGLQWGFTRLEREGVRVEFESWQLAPLSSLLGQGLVSPRLEGLRVHWTDPSHGQVLLDLRLDGIWGELSLMHALRGEVHLSDTGLSGLRVTMSQDILDRLTSAPSAARDDENSDAAAREKGSFHLADQLSKLPPIEWERLTLRDIRADLAVEGDDESSYFELKGGFVSSFAHRVPERQLGFILEGYDDTVLAVSLPGGLRAQLPLQALVTELELRYGGRRDPVKASLTQLLIELADWSVVASGSEIGSALLRLSKRGVGDESEVSCSVSVESSADSGFESAGKLRVAPCGLGLEVGDVVLEAPSEGLRLSGSGLTMLATLLLEDELTVDLFDPAGSLVLPTVKGALELSAANEPVLKVGASLSTLASGHNALGLGLQAHLGRLESYLSEFPSADMKGVGLETVQQKVASYRSLLRDRRLVFHFETRAAPSFLAEPIRQAVAPGDKNAKPSSGQNVEALLASFLRARPEMRSILLSYREGGSVSFPPGLSPELVSNVLAARDEKSALDVLRESGGVPRGALSNLSPFAFGGASLRVEESLMSLKGLARARDWKDVGAVPLALGMLSAEMDAEIELWAVGSPKTTSPRGSARVFFTEELRQSTLGTWVNRPVKRFALRMSGKGEGVQMREARAPSPFTMESFQLKTAFGLTEDGRVVLEESSAQVESGSLKASWKGQGDIEGLLSSGEIESELKLQAAALTPVPTQPTWFLKGEAEIPLRVGFQMQGNNIEKVLVAAELALKGVRLESHGGAGNVERLLVVDGLEGRLPVRQDLQLVPAAEGSSFPFQVVWEPLLQENPFRRAGGAKLSGLYSASRNLSVRLVEIAGQSGSIGPVAASVALKQNQMLMDDLNGEAFGGVFTGQSYVTVKQGGLDLAFSGRLSGLDGGVLLGLPGLSKQDAVIGGRAALVFRLVRSDIEGRMDLDRVPRALLDQLLIRLDPAGSDSKIGAARLALGVAAPGRLGVEMGNGLADISIEVVGPAGEQSIRIPALPLNRVIEGRTGGLQRSLESAVGAETSEEP